MRTGTEKIINGVDCALLQAEAVLNAEEPDVHVQDLRKA